MTTSYFSSPDTPAEAQQRKSYLDAMRREYVACVGGGSVEDLDLALAAWRREQAELLDGFDLLTLQAVARPNEFAEALEANVSRRRVLAALIGDAERALRAARESRSAELARVFVKDKATRQLYLDAAASWARQLEPVAALANAYDAAALAGAATSAMPPLPQTRLAELGQLINWVKVLRRWDIDPTGVLPPSLRERIEATS
jgi:hypothetical protein